MSTMQNLPVPTLRIALSAQSQSRLLFLAVARRLRETYGAEIHLYCYGAQELDYYNKANVDNLFATITKGSLLNSHCFAKGLDHEKTVERAKVWEQRIGVTFNRLMVSDRHCGRGFVLGGPNHPRSRYSDETSYTQILHAHSEILDFWNREFTEKKIDLIVNGTKDSAFISRYLNIPYRTMAGSRYENYHYWAENELYENSAFARRFHELKGPSDLKFDTPYFAHSANRKHLAKIFKFWTMVHKMGAMAARYVYWRLRRYEKAKGYYFWENIKYYYRVWADYRKHHRIARARLSDLDGKTFVYFPLHIEPEVALHGISPEYFYQHAAIAALARDMPAGVMLAVKEAYGSIGRRPKEFYRQIADLKNVVWLDCWESGIQCAQKASVVATICGTAGLEASIAGRPVISFGHHNIYNVLPSVGIVEDGRDLAGMLRQALENKESVSIRRDASRLLQAIVDCSFDLGQYDYINLAQFDDAVVERLCESLFASLERQTTQSSVVA